nr:hypothetical protein Iba_chr14fCG7530 [Ipomoea batatas]
MNLGCTRKMKKEVREARRAAAASRDPLTQPPAPSCSSSSQPVSSGCHVPSSPSNQLHSPPILSPDNSIFSESVASSAKDPTPAPSSSLPATP